MKDTDALYEEIQQGLGIDFTPNIFRAMQDKPEVLFGTWLLIKSTLLTGELARVYKEIIFTYVANVRECRYCYYAHRALAKQLGMKDELLNYISPSKIKFIEPELLRVLLQLADCLLRDEAKVDETLSELRALNVPEQHVCETILMVGTASHMCILANGLQLGSCIDKGFCEMLKN